MRLFAQALRIHLLRLLRDKAFWIITLVVWAGLLGGGLLLVGQGSAIAVRAGIVFSPEDAAAAQVYDSLPEDSLVQFEAFSTDELEAVEQLVRTGKLECAYLLEAPFEQVLSQKGLEGAVTQIVSPNTVADVIVQELVYAGVLEAYAPELTLEIILNVMNGADAGYLGAYIEERFGWYTTEGADQFLEQQAEMVQSGGPGEEQARGNRQLHGVIAVFLLALTLFSLPRLIGDKTPGLWLRLGFGGLLRYYAGVACALWMFSLLAALPALLLLQVVYPAGMGPLAVELVTLAGYGAALSAGGVCVVLLLKKPDLLLAGAAFVLLLAVVFGGVLLDWYEISAQLGNICRWLFTERYIAGVLSATFGQAGWLFAASGCCTILAVILLFFGLKGRKI